MDRSPLPGEPGGEPNTVIVKGCHGARFRFHDDEDGTYTPFPGVWATLTRTLTSPYTYTLTGVGQSTYLFDSAGRLAQIRDPQGQVTALTYSGTQLVRVEDGTGERFLAFAYDGQGRLAEVRDPINRTVQYGYDEAGDLTVVTDTRGLAWTYAYTGTHLLCDVRDPADHVVERTEYDDQGRAVRQRDGTLGHCLAIRRTTPPLPPPTRGGMATTASAPTKAASSTGAGRATTAPCRAAPYEEHRAYSLQDNVYNDLYTWTKPASTPTPTTPPIA
ncbi:MAG: RHS repeat domain-containing protein [Anaerolineae bacterium]